MSRIVLSLFSALTLVYAYFWLSGAPKANAAEAGGILAPGTPPLTRDVSDASTAVTLFMLKQVASGDASASDLSVDQGLLDEWADLMASEYVGFSADEQAELASMPVLRGALREAWSRSTPTDRAALRDAFRPIAQEWLSGMSCDGFTSLADAGFVEKTSTNVQRYLSCDAELDSGASPVVAPAPRSAPVAVSAPVAAPAPVATSSTVSPTAAAQRASAGLQASHNMYVNMSNALLENHVGNMNAILNMGNNNYHYVYSKP